jgi:predicted metal-dependent hydrolase
VHRSELQEGIRLFNAGEYFAAHEVLEDVWRSVNGPDKTFLQGLVQLAVAFHHYSTGNRGGAASVLAKATRNLERCPAGFQGLDIAGLMAAVGEWSAALADGQQPPPPPRITRLTPNST